MEVRGEGVGDQGGGVGMLSDQLLVLGLSYDTTSPLFSGLIMHPVLAGFCLLVQINLACYC